MSLCHANRRDDSPCRVAALLDDAYCWAHSPNRAEQRRQARAAGGQGHGKRVRAAHYLAVLPVEYRGLIDKLMNLMEAVEAGDVKARDADTIGSLAGHVLAWVKFAVELRSQSEMYDRLAALEATAARRPA